MAGVDPVVERLALESSELSVAIRELQERRQAVHERLRDLVGAGRAQRAPRLSVSVGRPGRSVRVLSRSEVPPELMSLQPDKRRILEAYDASGECPRGVSVRECLPRVTITLRQVSRVGLDMEVAR